MSTETEAFVEHINAQQVHELHGGHFMVVPQGCKIADLQSYSGGPRKVEAKPQFNDIESFIDYVKLYKKDESVLFADQDDLIFKAVLDYHNKASASWCSHKAVYQCKRADEWSIWLDKNDKGFTQEEFAEFLEDRAQDVTEPTGGELLELATQFRVIRKAVFGSAMRLSTGEFQLQYSEDNQKGTIEFPEEFTLGIAPFHNGDKYEVKARLRYRLREGNVTFSYKLIEPSRIVEHAFSETIDKVKKALPKMHLFEGKDQ